MPTLCFLADPLPEEHVALCRAYAAVQERCSRMIAQQQAEIAHLQAQVLRLRAAAIVQVSARAFVRADPVLLQASMAAAEWVICQTGCLSHGAYWRDHGHCRRTGNACTVPEAPATPHLVAKTAASPFQASADSYQKK